MADISEARLTDDQLIKMKNTLLEQFNAVYKDDCGDIRGNSFDITKLSFDGRIKCLGFLHEQADILLKISQEADQRIAKQAENINFQGGIKSPIEVGSQKMVLQQPKS